MGLAASSGVGRIGYLLANSAAVQAVGGALVTVLLGWIGTLFANRKRIAWRAYLDAPINLTPAQVRSMNTRLKFRHAKEPRGRRRTSPQFTNDGGHRIDQPAAEQQLLGRSELRREEPVRGRAGHGPAKLGDRRCGSR
jgi:hypothetical protein